MKRILGAGLLVVWAAMSQAAESENRSIELNKKTVVSFASVETGRKVLATRDDFVKRLSPFDRAARMKTDKEISEKEYLEFVAKHVEAWTPEEVEKVKGAFESLRPKLAGLKWDLPETVLMIKTSGVEEGDMAYTRSNAIILPPALIRYPPGGLEHLVAHELFHVLTRHDPKLRNLLYPIIGFEPCNEIEFPKELASRKITNPDAPTNDFYITVTSNGERLPVVPILYSRDEKYDVAAGGEFLRSLVFEFLVIEKKDGRWAPRYKDGEPYRINATENEDYFEQIGKNTRYIIHPEEILADNFGFLVTGRQNLPNPEIVEKMRKVLFEEK